MAVDKKKLAKWAKHAEEFPDYLDEEEEEESEEDTPEEEAVEGAEGEEIEEEEEEETPEEEALEEDEDLLEGEEAEEPTPEDIQALADLIEDGMGDEEIMPLVENYNPDEGEGENPAAWVDSEDIWEQAKKAVGPEGKEYAGDHYWAVVAHVYKSLGGAFKKPAKK